MEVLRALIFGWSLVLSSTMFFRGANGASIFAAVLYRNVEHESSLLWFTPVYVFLVWMIGCLIIISLWLLSKRIFDRIAFK